MAAAQVGRKYQITRQESQAKLRGEVAAVSRRAKMGTLAVATGQTGVPPSYFNGRTRHAETNGDFKTV